MIRKLLVVGAALSLTACASANKRLEQGQDLQRSGRPAEAAERFIQALKKDSRLDSARAGLKSAGAATIAGYLNTAADPATQPDGAADAFVAIDDLSRRALDVGVFLVPPNDYDARRRSAFDKAIADDISDAPLLTGQRQFSSALNRLARASNVYQPNPTQASAIGTAGAQVAIAWGQADMTDGQFRSAYSRVDPIVNAQGLSSALTSQARALQSEALSRGSKRVAVLPTWATVNARRDLPDETLPALADAMFNAPWTQPPQFVTVIPYDQVDRDLRRMGMSRRTLTSGEAARYARTVGADLVVVAEIDSVRREDVSVRSTRRPVRTRSGIDTAYYVDEGSARLFGRTTYVVFDQNGQRVSEYQAVSSTGSAPFTRVRYVGDWGALDLRQADRELFTNRAGDRDLVNSFVSAMSPRLGEAVFAEVVRRIP